MFTATERDGIRAAMVELARTDPRIAGAALVGSAARGTEDAWSDIDLVLQLAEGADEASVVDAWTAWMTRAWGVSDRFDVMAGGVRYRVFLLPTSLQIDVSFWPYERFGATEDAFDLLFGEPQPPRPPRAPDPGDTIGMGWLYAIHARTAIARGRAWQAQLMLDDLRTAVLTLACLDAGLNPWHGREVDRLPPDLLDRLASARAGDLGTAELRRSLAALGDELLAVAARHDPERSTRLRVPMRVIAGE